MSEDWRITNQTTYMTGLTLRWTKWSEYREGWDHDPCEFCFDKFGRGDRGFVTDDDYRWVCATCCRDFRELFNWVVDAARSDASLGDVL